MSALSNEHIDIIIIMSDGLCLALVLRVGMPTTVHINMTYNSDIYM